MRIESWETGKIKKKRFFCVPSVKYAHTISVEHMSPTAEKAVSQKHEKKFKNNVREFQK